MIVQRAWPQHAPNWLNEAAARIGSSLDLAQTASEVVDAAVPWFADAAAIYAVERLLAADELASPRAGPGSAVRRLAARLSGQGEAVTDTPLPPGEVLVLGADTLRSRAMATGEPVLSGQPASEIAAPTTHDPDSPEIAAGCTSFLAMPLIARGVMVGCAVFGRAAGQPRVQLR